LIKTTLLSEDITTKSHYYTKRMWAQVTTTGGYYLDMATGKLKHVVVTWTLPQTEQIHSDSRWQARWCCRNVGLDQLVPGLTPAPNTPPPETTSRLKAPTNTDCKQWLK